MITGKDSAKKIMLQSNIIANEVNKNKRKEIRRYNEYILRKF